MYIFRPLQLSDLDGIMDLFPLDSDEADRFRLFAGVMPTDDVLMRHIWDDPDYDPELVTGAFINEELVGFCIAVRRAWKRGRETTGYIKWVYVAPKYRRQGLGSRLLQDAESVLQSRGVSELIYGSASPQYFWPGAADDATKLLLDKSGWSRGSERINLSLSLPISVPLIPCNVCDIEVRLAELSDGNALRAFITSEFSESWCREVESVFQSEAVAFGLIAIHEGNVVGFAAVHATNPTWFGPMGLSPSFRGKGIGRQLLLGCIEEATTRGESHLTIPWVNEGFYTRCLGKLPRQVFSSYSKKT